MPLRNRKKKRQLRPPTVTERVERIETLLENCRTDKNGVVNHRTLATRLDDHDLVIETLESELTDTMAENVVMRAKIDRLHNALGDVLWKDMNGVIRPITLLSTSHLKNILAGDFAKSLDVRVMIADELERREVDRRFRSPWRRIWRALTGQHTVVVEHIEEEPLPPGGYPPVEPGNIHPGVRKAKRIKGREPRS